MIVLKNTLLLAGVAVALLAHATLPGIYPAAQGPEVDEAHPLLKRAEGKLLFQGRSFSGTLVSTRQRADFRDGLQEGQARTFYPDGRLESLRFYGHGEKVGVHKGWWQDGRPKFRYEFSGGQFEGLCQDWYRDGRLCQEMHYRAGHEVGEQTIYRPDGSLHSHYVMQNGERYGLVNSRTCRKNAR